MSNPNLSAVLMRRLQDTDVSVLHECALNVPEHQWQKRTNDSIYWLVEAGGEDYGDYKIARFDLYCAGKSAFDNNFSQGLYRLPRWVKKEGWKICRIGDFDIYSMTCSPPRFVRQLNDCRQLRAITITIKYNERSD